MDQGELSLSPVCTRHSSSAPGTRLMQKVEAELDRLVAEGTLASMEYSEWATPIVAVVKAIKRAPEYAAT